MEPRARVSVWPGRRRVPGIVAPDSWGARGAECLPRDVLRRSSPATSPCDGTTARRCLCHGTGSGTTEARPPASSVPPALMGVWGVIAPPGQFRAGFSEQQEGKLDVEQRGRGDSEAVLRAMFLDEPDFDEARSLLAAEEEGIGTGRPARARSWDWLDPPDTRIAQKANPNPSPLLSSQLQRNRSICPHVSGYFIRRRLKGDSSFPSLKKNQMFKP